MAGTTQLFRPTDLKARPDTIELAASGQSVSVNSLRVGMRLAQGLYDEFGVLLLASGTTITPDFLQLLRRRRLRHVKTSESTPPPAFDHIDYERIDSLDRQLACELHSRIPVRPLAPEHRPRIAFEAMLERARKGAKKHSAATNTLGEICLDLANGNLRSGLPETELHRIVREFGDMVQLDLDLLPTIYSLRTSPDDYLFQHCVNASILTMTIAVQLGLRSEKIMELGLGALLQDVGMLRVPREIRFARRPLTAQEMAEIQRHPAYSLDFLELIPGLPREVRFLAYQVHERLDQSGYPRHRSENNIHAYAKIVSIADAFAAMTCERPYRKAMHPYEAAKTILLECGAGRFDRTFVRAFLDSVSLFPVGCRLELDNKRVARVIRANTSLHVRPIVMLLDEQGRDTNDVVDLAEERDVNIVRVLPQV